MELCCREEVSKQMTPPASTFELLTALTNKVTQNRPVKSNLIDITKILPKNMYAKSSTMNLPEAPPTADKVVKDAFVCLNLSRTAPVFFVNTFLEPIRGRFVKSFIYKDFGNKTRRTHEGIDGTNHIIKYMSHEAQRTHSLEWDKDLAELAKDRLSSIALDSYTSMKYSGLSGANIASYNINPKCKIDEFCEGGSTVGIEAIALILIDDGNLERNNKRIRNDEFKYVGIAHDKNNRQFGSLTYILVADSKLHEFDHTQIVQNPITDSPEPAKKKAYSNWFKRSPKKDSPRKNMNDTTRFEDKRSLQNDTVMPMVNQYDTEANGYAGSPERSSPAKPADSQRRQYQPAVFNNQLEGRYDQPTREDEIMNMKHRWNPTTQRDTEKVDLSQVKPPSYFKINI